MSFKDEETKVVMERLEVEAQRKDDPLLIWQLIVLQQVVVHPILRMAEPALADQAIHAFVRVLKECGYKTAEEWFAEEDLVKRVMQEVKSGNANS